MKYFIGIEGLAMRYSIGVLADETGRVLSSHRLQRGPISFHTTPRDLMRSRLKELLRNLCHGVGRNLNTLEDAMVCIGLTGVTFPSDSQELAEEFAKTEIRVGGLVATGDAEIVFWSHSRSSSGSVILCHMGSTALACRENRFVRFGGWGPAIGDEGSGYALGRNTVRLIGEEHDERVQPSTLWKCVAKWLASSHREVPEWYEASIRWRERIADYGPTCDDQRALLFGLAHELHLIGSWRLVAAGLVIPLVQAAEEGYEPAIQLLRSGAADLVDQHARACFVLGGAQPIQPVILYGGAITHNRLFRDMIVEELRNRNSTQNDLRVVSQSATGGARPAIGALLCALARFRNTHVSQLPARIVDAVTGSALTSDHREALLND